MEYEILAWSVFFSYLVKSNVERLEGSFKLSGCVGRDAAREFSGRVGLGAAEKEGRWLWSPREAPSTPAPWAGHPERAQGK